MKKSALRPYMPEHRSEEIEPSASVKDRLDQALKAKRTRLHEIRLPLYQSVAAAVLLLVAGMGVGQFFDKPQPVLERIVQQVKFVDRPVKEIQYIRVPVRVESTSASNSETVKKESAPVLNTSSSNENDLAVTDQNHVEAGISMGDDTILQKMLVTIY